LLDTDPRFATQESRTQNAEAIGGYLAERLPARTNAEWLKVLTEVDIPACPVNSIEDLTTDPHLRAVGLFETVEHPTEGTMTSARFPVCFSATPADVRRLAPNLGEHTDEVLGRRPNSEAA
jgi:crotonobetainyl-CoA:carnitine CoA-transferase CaiB-like acyl-CoA transferase